MNTQQKCPHCGSQAEEVGRHAKSVDLSEISFRCLNKSCGSGFTGVLTLTRSGVAGAQNFDWHLPPTLSEQEMAAAGAAMSGRNMTETIKTDC